MLDPRFTTKVQVLKEIYVKELLFRKLIRYINLPL